MKSKLLYILILIISIAMLSSCIMENSQCPPDGKVVISFSFSTQDNMTRAGHTWGDNLDDDTTNDYEPSYGDDYDTRIKVKSLRAFIYDAEGFICEITNKTYFELDDATGGTIEPNRYRFLGELNLTPQIYSRVKGKTCKVMLVANHALPEDPNSFGNTTFSVDNMEMPNGFIPMWGVTSLVLTLEPQQDLGTIYLLRSAAKVEVKLSQSLVNDGYKIKETFINKHATTGYWFPNGWNDVTSTISLNHSGCYKPISVSNNAKYFTKSSDSNNVIYLPEMETTGADISIVLTKGTSEYTFSNAIKFAKYESGFAGTETFNVVRNHHYEYTIDRVNTNGDLVLTCAVQPWTLKEESWDYTDVPAVGTGGNISWNIQTNGNRVVFPLISSYADFTFGLSSPASATWRVEFVTNKGKQNAFQLTKVINGVEQISDVPNYYMTGNIGEKVTLRVRPTSSAIDENNEANLRILVVLSDGRIIRVSEFLDEERDEEGNITKEGQEYIMVQTP